MLDPASEKTKGKTPSDFSDFVKQRKNCIINSSSQQGLTQTWKIKSSYFN